VFNVKCQFVITSCNIHVVEKLFTSILGSKFATKAIKSRLKTIVTNGISVSVVPYRLFTYANLHTLYNLSELAYHLPLPVLHSQRKFGEDTDTCTVSLIYLVRAKIHYTSFPVASRQAGSL